MYSTKCVRKYIMDIYAFIHNVWYGKRQNGYFTKLVLKTILFKISVYENVSK